MDAGLPASTSTVDGGRCINYSNHAGRPCVMNINATVAPGTATPGTFGPRVRAGTIGWTAMREMALGDFNRDGYTDLLAAGRTTDRLWLYPGAATGVLPQSGLAPGTRRQR